MRTHAEYKITPDPPGRSGVILSGYSSATTCTAKPLRDDS